MPVSDDDFVKSLGRAPYSEVKDKPPPEPTAREKAEGMGAIEQTARGVGQALANIPETPLYYLEKGIRQVKPDFNIVPERWRKSAREFRDVAESTPFGIGGEIAGSFLSGSAEIGALSKLPAVARFVSKFPRIGGTALGSVAGLWSRPAESPKEAIIQAGTGGLFGLAGGQAALSAERAAATRAAAESQAINAAGKAARAKFDAEQAAQFRPVANTADVRRASDMASMAARTKFEAKQAAKLANLPKATKADIKRAGGAEAMAARAKFFAERTTKFADRPTVDPKDIQNAADMAERAARAAEIHKAAQRAVPGMAGIDRGIVFQLAHLPTTMRHILAQWLMSGGQALPRGGVPGMAGQAVGQAVEHNQ